MKKFPKCRSCGRDVERNASQCQNCGRNFTFHRKDAAIREPNGYGNASGFSTQEAAAEFQEIVDKINAASMARARAYESEEAEAKAAVAEALTAIFKQFPPPSECERCGEAGWNLVSVSPNKKSAKYACGYCQKMVVVKANEVAVRAANKGREPIPKEIQREVWRRDNGKCVVCGSQENLEFDHIIAVSLGGATTVRNLQLLCLPCNRKKSAKEPGSH